MAMAGLRAVALFLRSTSGAVPCSLCSDSPWSSWPQPMGSGGDATPCKVTREEHGLSFEFNVSVSGAGCCLSVSRRGGQSPRHREHAQGADAVSTAPQQARNTGRSERTATVRPHREPGVRARSTSYRRATPASDRPQGPAGDHPQKWRAPTQRLAGCVFLKPGRRW